MLLLTLRQGRLHRFKDKGDRKAGQIRTGGQVTVGDIEIMYDMLFVAKRNTKMIVKEDTLEVPKNRYITIALSSLKPSVYPLISQLYHPN